LSMKEKHQGKFRFHIPLLLLLLTFALTSLAQQTSPDTAVFIPSIDSLPAQEDSVATAVPIDRDANFEGDDEDGEEGVKDDEKEKNKFI
jgi:hypothetical protein